MRVRGIGALLALAPAVLRAQDSAEIYEQKIRRQGKAVIDRCIQALGGDRFLLMRNRVEQGMVFSFYREDLNGLDRAIIYTSYDLNPTPGKLSVRERESFGKKKEENGAVLFTEREAFEVTFRGARPIPDDRFNRYRDSVMHDVFYILLQRLKEPGMIFEYQRGDLFESRPVDIVNITDSENRVTTVYVDRLNHLPVRQVFQRRNDVTHEMNEEVTVYALYRDVGGGVQWPFSIQRSRDGEKVYQMFASSVQIDQDLPDRLFTLPSGIKMLKPQ